MAYSGENVVLQFQHPGSLIAVTDSVIDVSATGAPTDYAVIICPIPFMIYQFGMFVTQTGGATLTGDVTLLRSTFAAGTDITIVGVDLDSTDLNSGAATTASITASTGAEAILLDGVIWSPTSVFPYIVSAAHCLTVALTNTSAVGEYVPFVVGRWLGLDWRSTEVWGS